MKLHLAQPKQRVTILLGFMGLIGLWVYISLLLVPVMRQSAKLGKEVRTARDQLKNLEQVLTNETRVREQHTRLEETVASLRTLLPSEQELPAMIERLSNLASQADVKIQTIFPQLSYTEKELAGLVEKGDVKRPVYRTIPIQIDALAGFHGIGTFLSLVESAAIPMEISSLRIGTDSKEVYRHDMKLILDVYFATAEPDQAAGQSQPVSQGGS